MVGRKPGAASQATRMFKIADALKAHRFGLTYEQLAEMFGVHERTIKRDLRSLEDSGRELERTKGEDGRTVVRLQDQGRARLDLTLKERYALLAARRLFDVFEGTPFREEIRSIFNKVAGSLPKSQRADLDDIEDRVVFVPDNGRKSYERKADELSILMEAALKSQEINFDYRRPRGEPKVRRGVLQPYALVLYRYGLYVVGRRIYPDEPEGAVRIFAVERFRKLEPRAGEFFERPEDFSVDRYFRGAFGIHTGTEETEVVLRFSRQAAPYVSARTYQEGQQTKLEDNGTMRLQFHVTDLTEVVPFVLQWGRNVQVLSPRHLREQVEELRRPGRRFAS